MQEHEAEALTEKVGLSIWNFGKDFIVVTEITNKPKSDSMSITLTNNFTIYKENDLWVVGKLSQRGPIIFKISEHLEIVLKATADRFKMNEITHREDDLQLLMALAKLQKQLLVTDLIDERHLLIRNKNLDYPPTEDERLDFYSPIVESYYQSDAEWVVTIEFVDDGWLIYSDDLEAFQKHKKVKTLEEAIKLVTAQYSPPRANLDPLKKYH